MRITKDDLITVVARLNGLCEDKGINKSFEIGYRYGNCYLDQQSKTHEHCIEKTITCGTKKDVYYTMQAMCEVLY